MTDTPRCGCAAFQFRGRCKHTGEVGLLTTLEAQGHAALDRCAEHLDALQGQLEQAEREAATRRIALAALRTWRAELAAGKRTPTTFDCVWRAACWTMDGLDSQPMSRDTAADSFAAARALLERVVRESKAAA